jgi:hypothetical protein
MQQVSKLANCTSQRLLTAPGTLPTRDTASSAQLSLRTTRCGVLSPTVLPWNARTWSMHVVPMHVDLASHNPWKVVAFRRQGWTCRFREVHPAAARSVGRSNGVQHAAGRHAFVMSAATSGANAADQKAAQGRPEDFLGEPLIFGMPQAAVWHALIAVIMLHVPGPCHAVLASNTEPAISGDMQAHQKLARLRMKPTRCWCWRRVRSFPQRTTVSLLRRYR